MIEQLSTYIGFVSDVETMTLYPIIFSLNMIVFILLEIEKLRFVEVENQEIHPELNHSYVLNLKNQQK